ncbi:MAG: hypothetical protein GY711_24370 [bacterium]|nr:hypothetical protein [bacterium]
MGSVVGTLVGGVASGVLYWMPVWVPMLLLWQVVDRGLRPARAEAERLAGEEQTVDARYSSARKSFERMQAEAKAWTDPVYRERVRRLRLAESAAAADSTRETAVSEQAQEPQAQDR